MFHAQRHIVNDSTGSVEEVFLQRGRIACNAKRSIRHGNSVSLLHAGTLSRRMKIGSRGLHHEVAKTL